MEREKVESYIFLAAIVLAAVLVALIFLPELNAIVLGITFAVLFQPLYDWLVKKMPKDANGAALLVVLLTILIVLTPLAIIGWQLVGEATSLYGALSTGQGIPAVQYLDARLAATNPVLGTDFNTYLQQFFGWVAGSIGSLFSGIAGILFAILLSFFALFYFLRDGDRLREAILERSPLPREGTANLIARLRVVMSSIVRGSLLIAALYGIAGGLGFFIFGLPSGVFWGVITAFASFIPLFGTYLVIVPGMVVLAVGHHYVAAVGLFIWIGAVGLFMENYLRPRLIGRKANIHPLLVLFSVVGGISVFGPLGILLGPLALGLLIALIDVYPVLAHTADGNMKGTKKPLRQRRNG